MPLAPEYEAMFAQLAENEPAPAISDLPTDQAREVYRAMRPLLAELPIHRCEDRIIQGSQGDIPLRIYTPEGDGPFGLLVYFHGGGWVIGDLDCSDAVCRQLATQAGVRVISVAYRLAPEDLFPVAVVDCFDAVCWVADNMSALDGNGKLGVTGESAGGNLAAVVCLKSREEKGPKINFQCLLYPVTDADMTRPSYEENGAGYLLETQTMAWFWDTYCPQESQRSHPYASPLRAASLAELPPALVITAEYDPLRDEGEAYAEALNNAGTPATYSCYPGLVHDFLATAALFECSKPGLAEAVNAFRQHLA